MFLITLHLGDWEKCYSILSEFTIGREPYFETCSPDDQGHNSESFAFSEFWYSMEEVFGMGKNDFILRNYGQIDFCLRSRIIKPKTSICDESNQIDFNYNVFAVFPISNWEN